MPLSYTQTDAFELHRDRFELHGLRVRADGLDRDCRSPLHSAGTMTSVFELRKQLLFKTVHTSHFTRYTKPLGRLASPRGGCSGRHTLQARREGPDGEWVLL